MSGQVGIDDIVTDGLSLYLDASSPLSYPGSGSIWYDLSPRKAHGTINGTIPFVSDSKKSYFNFATSSDSNYIYNTTSYNYLDFFIVFAPDLTFNNSGATNANIVGLIANGSNSSLSDKSFRFVSVDGSGTWNVVGRNPGDANDWAYSTATTFYNNGSVDNTLSLIDGWNFIKGYRTNQSSFPLNFSYYIGSSGYTNRGFRGKISIVMLYNKQLSEAEYLQNYNALRYRFD